MSRILVAEDDPPTLELTLEVLTSAGFDCIAAHDGVAALERLAREPFDLLITDVRMPRMDGLELLWRVRELPQPPQVIVLTSDDAPETVLAAIRGQALHYLTKPVDIGRLAALVREVLAAPRPSHPIEVISARPHWVELLVPCEFSAVDRIQGFLQQLEGDLPSDVREAVGRVFRELLLNAVEWGGKLDPSRKVRISYLRARRMLLYRITDPGPGFDIANVPHAAVNNPADSPMNHALVREEQGLRPGGLGLLIAQSMADELLYNEAQNEVVFVKYLT
jgi:CheY-like chemotaxis protein/anti-sigma regulatory factor (Ser/Thr protein kinase)